MKVHGPIPNSVRTGNVLEDFPAILILGLFGLHPQRIAVCPNLVLQAGNDADGDGLLIGSNSVSGTDHLRTFHCLCMPVITVQSTVQMSITLSLEELVVVVLLVKEMHVVVLAVSADLFDHRAHVALIFPNELGILYLFAFEFLGLSFLLGESAFEF